MSWTIDSVASARGFRVASVDGLPRGGRGVIYEGSEMRCVRAVTFHRSGPFVTLMQGWTDEGGHPVRPTVGWLLCLEGEEPPKPKKKTKRKKKKTKED